MSDNGAAYRDFIISEDHKELREYYNDDYENMGRADSYISYGPQWAEAGTSPFRYFKDYATQGGINTPMIICGPYVSKRNEIYHGFTSVQDLAPTFYEVAGIAYPEIFEEREVYPLKGTSLLPYVSGKSSEIHSDEYVFAMEHYGHAMLRKGNWKITNFTRPFELENFMLYDLSTDIGEQTDLREAEPDKYKAMLREWADFSHEIQLQIPPPTPSEE
jgi:arylsulfatase